jgi:hypothetical protein
MMARRGSECPYDAQNIRVTVHSAKSLVRVGSYRSLGGAVNHFARERTSRDRACDRIDPVGCGCATSNPRFRRVVAAARRFGWKARPSAGALGGNRHDAGYVGACLEVEVGPRSMRRVGDAGLRPDGIKAPPGEDSSDGSGVALYRDRFRWMAEPHVHALPGAPSNRRTRGRSSARGGRGDAFNRCRRAGNSDSGTRHCERCVRPHRATNKGTATASASKTGTRSSCTLSTLSVGQASARSMPRGGKPLE